MSKMRNVINLLSNIAMEKTRKNKQNRTLIENGSSIDKI